MKGKILVIEDNFEVRDNLVELLELDGYQVSQAENGRQGIKMAHEQDPDLILCDIMMPELDGYGVLKIVSRNEKLMHVPFMFLTALAEKSDIRKGMGLGADDYITKPFNEAELLDAVEVRMKKRAVIKDVMLHNKTSNRSFIDEKKAIHDFKDFLGSSPKRTFLKKEEIYTLGQYTRNVYIVHDGLLKEIRYSEFGKELITDFYTADDIFGYYDHSMNSKLSATVTVIKQAQLSVIPVADFEKFLHEHEDFAILYRNQELRKIRYAYDKLVDFAYASLREKVAKSIYELSAKIGEREGVVEVSRTDLAAYTGLAKETVIRTLSELKKDAIIAVKGAEIEILDPLKLQAIFK